MRHFEPTLGINDTSRNVRDFVKEHTPIFWDIFKPLIPYIAILYLIDLGLSLALGVDPETGEQREVNIGSMIAGYFYSCLIISWHRVVIHGPDRYEPMDPLRPQKSDWAFIGMGILLFLVPFIVGAVIGVSAGLAGMPVLLFLLIPLILGSVYIGFKIIFYFPSKATGNNVTLQESFAMTTGYIWKLIGANFLAALKTFLFMVLYIILGIVVLGIIGATIGGAGLLEQAQFIFSIMGVIYALPIAFYFQPLLTIIGVTVLSNYYQHALQNKGAPTP